MAKLQFNSSGQALVVVLLIMSVVLTIALSVVSRSVTDITVSRKEEDALRAFSAAEAGIEKTLITGSGSSCTAGSAGCLPDAGFTATITGLASGSKEYGVPVSLNSGEAISVWLSAHNASGNIVCDATNQCFNGNRIKVCWGDPGTSANTSTTPAMTMAVIYTTTNNFSTSRVARAAFDPNSSRRSDNQFDPADGSCTVDNRSFAFSKELDLSSLGVTTRSDPASLAGPQQVRIRLLYNTNQDHGVGFSVNYPGNGIMPQQGTKIESLGESGDAKRKVIVNRLYSDMPPMFDFTLFSATGDLSK